MEDFLFLLMDYIKCVFPGVLLPLFLGPLVQIGAVLLSFYRRARTQIQVLTLPRQALVLSHLPTAVPVIVKVFYTGVHPTNILKCVICAKFRPK